MSSKKAWTWCESWSSILGSYKHASFAQRECRVACCWITNRKIVTWFVIRQLIEAVAVAIEGNVVSSQPSRGGGRSLVMRDALDSRSGYDRPSRKMKSNAKRTGREVSRPVRG